MPRVLHVGKKGINNRVKDPYILYVSSNWSGYYWRRLCDINEFHGKSIKEVLEIVESGISNTEKSILSNNLRKSKLEDKIISSCVIKQQEIDDAWTDYRGCKYRFNLIKGKFFWHKGKVPKYLSYFLDEFKDDLITIKEDLQMCLRNNNNKIWIVDDYDIVLNDLVIFKEYITGMREKALLKIKNFSQLRELSQENYKSKIKTGKRKIPLLESVNSILLPKKMC